MLLTIESCAHRGDDAEEPVSLITSGRLCLDGERAVLQYDETLDESLPPQHVTVTLEDGTVQVERDGDYATQLVFHKGRRYQGQYETPFGRMELAVFCTKLRYELDEDGGEIHVSYQMDLNGQFAAMHDMEITLMKQDG